MDVGARPAAGGAAETSSSAVDCARPALDGPLGTGPLLATAAWTRLAVFESANVLSVVVCSHVCKVSRHSWRASRRLQSALGLTAAPGTVMLPRSHQAAPVYAGQCWCVARPPVGSGGTNSPHVIACARIYPFSPVTCCRWSGSSRPCPLCARCRCTAVPPLYHLVIHLHIHMWWHRVPLPA